jgi:hypothetical protein
LYFIISWDMIQCGTVKDYWCFGGTYCLHLQRGWYDKHATKKTPWTNCLYLLILRIGRFLISASLILKMRAIRSPEL